MEPPLTDTQPRSPHYNTTVCLRHRPSSTKNILEERARGPQGWKKGQEHACGWKNESQVHASSTLNHIRINDAVLEEEKKAPKWRWWWFIAYKGAIWRDNVCRTRPPHATPAHRVATPSKPSHPRILRNWKDAEKLSLRLWHESFVIDCISFSWVIL